MGIEINIGVNRNFYFDFLNFLNYRETKIRETLRQGAEFSIVRLFGLNEYEHYMAIFTEGYGRVSHASIMSEQD